MIRRNALTVFLIAFLGLYHVGNVLKPDNLGRLSWKTEPVRLKIDKRVVAEVPVWAFDGNFKDYSSELIGGAGYILRFLVGQTPVRVIKRPDGDRFRLYLRDEVTYLFSSAIPLVREGFVEQTKAVTDYFSAAGATIILLPMPPKIAIERSLLPAKLPASQIWQPDVRSEVEAPYDVYREVAHADPKHTVDMYAIYQREQPRFSAVSFYRPYGTQWSSLGIALGVVGTIEKLRGLGWKLREPRIREVKTDLIPDHESDFLGFYILPRFFSAFLTGDRAERLFTVDPVTDEPGEGKIFLSGTCYAAMYKESEYGFGKTLAKALNRELIDGSVAGGKSLPAWDNLMNHEARIGKGDLVLWEFALREPFGKTESPLAVIQRRDVASTPR